MGDFRQLNPKYGARLGFIAISPGNWGTGNTLEEAKENLGRHRLKEAFIDVHVLAPQTEEDAEAKFPLSFDGSMIHSNCGPFINRKVSTVFYGTDHPKHPTYEKRKKRNAHK